jgi:hypothetical protein
MVAEWAVQEVGDAQLGDARRTKRLVRVISDLAARPMASVPQVCGDGAATKAVYRFWDSPSVTADAIRAAHRDQTLERLSSLGRMLIIQDTTSLDLTEHPKTTGLGPLDHAARLGLKVHSSLAVSVQGVPLGLIHQEVWARDPETVGKRHQRRQRETAEKESQRWLTAWAASQAVSPAHIETMTVADREADIYDFIAAPRRANAHLLIRATHNRRVAHEAEYLWEAIRQSPKRGEIWVELARTHERPTRRARLAIRYAPLEIKPPRHHLHAAELAPIAMQVILAEEEDAPPGMEPVCWLLLTTLPVDSLPQAVQVITWYTYRWLIERYHFVLKSGCRLEELQLETAARIQRALATYCIVAWRLLWLTYEARRQPDISCEVALETHEWQSLYATIHKTVNLPAEPPTLHQAIRWIAQLGGFLGRKSDGEPGVKTIWLGLRRLDDIAATWTLLRPTPSPT